MMKPADDEPESEGDATPKRVRPARPDRPSMPTAPDWSAAQANAATPADRLGEVSDLDDDIVFTPAQSAETLSRVPSITAGRHASVAPRKMTVQRTFIPILLTVGVLLILTGTFHFVTSDESSLNGLPASVSAILLLGGVVIFAAGVLNMLFVRAVLAARAPATGR